MFIIALFGTVNDEKQPECLEAGEQLSKLGKLHRENFTDILKKSHFLRIISDTAKSL